MTCRDALRRLAGRRECRIRLGLVRVERVLRRLGAPHEAVPCIHVAGTNGKGSVCAILDSVLRAAGWRSGLYLSPHLFSARERIQCLGRPVSARDFARLFAEVEAADAGRELTYFEMLTCMAFLHFARLRADVAVIETGLGGRLDATNVLPRPLASVLSSVHYDHASWLGPTLSRIGREKAGIIKPGCPVFCPRLPREALRVVARRAAACGAPLRVVRRPWRLVRADWRRNRQFLRGAGRTWELSLLGERQGGNAALAWSVLDGLSALLPVGEAAWREGLRRVRLPGRFQVLRAGGRTVILDGAHNPEAMEALKRTLAVSPWRRRSLRWIFGVMRDKDCAGIVDRVAERLRDVVAVSPPGPRALPARALAAVLRSRAPGASVSEASGAAAALRQWRRDPSAPRTALVCGSFYLAAAAARSLGGGNG